MAANPYLIPGTDCLYNELGFTDKTLLAQAEQSITSARLSSLEANPIPGNLDYAHLKAIHRSLFQDLYTWAGKERTVQTIKGITRFEWPEKIESQANALFEALKKEHHLQQLERPQFIQRAAYYFGELNVIHPFPEGNGRAQRVLFDQIARQAGHEFNWSRTSKDQLIEAVVHAYAIDTTKLEMVFDQTLLHPDRHLSHAPDSALDLTISNPVAQVDYENAVAFLKEHEGQNEGILYPDAKADPLKLEHGGGAANHELKNQFKEARAAVALYETNQELTKIFTQWRSLDTQISTAIQGNEKGLEKRLLQQKLRTLEKVTGRKKLFQSLSSHQKQKINHECDQLRKTLNLSRSRDLGHGR